MEKRQTDKIKVKDVKVEKKNLGGRGFRTTGGIIGLFHQQSNRDRTKVLANWQRIPIKNRKSETRYSKI